MTEDPERPASDPIVDAVEAQRSMVGRWGTYAVETIERAQTGDLDVRTWAAAWAEWATGTATDWTKLVRALSRIRSSDG